MSRASRKFSTTASGSVGSGGWPSAARVVVATPAASKTHAARGAVAVNMVRMGMVRDLLR